MEAVNPANQPFRLCLFGTNHSPLSYLRLDMQVRYSLVCPGPAAPDHHQDIGRSPYPETSKTIDIPVPLPPAAHLAQKSTVHIISPPRPPTLPNSQTLTLSSWELAASMRS
jgi:hypothetical protein